MAATVGEIMTGRRRQQDGDDDGDGGLRVGWMQAVVEVVVVDVD
jgi:hypothetical protein